MIRVYFAVPREDLLTHMGYSPEEDGIPWTRDKAIANFFISVRGNGDFELLETDLDETEFGDLQKDFCTMEIKAVAFVTDVNDHHRMSNPLPEEDVVTYPTVSLETEFVDAYDYITPLMDTVASVTYYSSSHFKTKIKDALATLSYERIMRGMIDFDPNLDVLCIDQFKVFLDFGRFFVKSN